MPCSADLKWPSHRTVYDPVAVNLSRGRKSRMEGFRHKSRAQNANCGRQHAVHRFEPLFGVQPRGRNVNVRALAERMHAGIRAARSDHRQARPAHPLKRRFKLVLDGVLVFLTLPAGEICSVVTDNELKPPRFRHLAGRDSLAG